MDLPGFGYAAVPEKVKRRWAPMIERYLEDRSGLAGVLALVDGRHAPTAPDRRMVGWLAEREIPTLVVLTKADKIPRGRRAMQLSKTARELGLEHEQVVWFSARTGEGRDEILSAAEALLGEVEG